MPELVTIRKNISYVAYIAAAVALVTLAIACFYIVTRQKDATNLVNQSYLIKIKTIDVLNVVRDAESAQRGFLFSKDSIFLNDFESSKVRIKDLVGQLSDQLSSDAGQAEKMRQLESLIDQRVKILEEVLYLYKEQNLGLLPKFSEGRKVMDTIELTGARIVSAEDILLQARLDAKNHADNLTFGAILFFTAVSFILLLFSFLKLKSENEKRTKAEINSDLLESKVKERTVEIANMNQQLQTQNKLLEKQNEELNSFTYIASHDLKEPLRKIEMFTSRITETEAANFSVKSAEYFESLILCTKRMQQLIDSVLSYGQLNGSDHFQPTDLNIILELAKDNLSEQISVKNANIVAGDLPVIEGIPEQMEQLFVNLISNALKYSKEGVASEVKIEAEYILDSTSNMHGWKLSFIDNGIGFSELYKEKIFQIFQRLHGKSDYPGTGIGLAICKKIAENHHGIISASSEPGKGSVFSILFPDNKT